MVKPAEPSPYMRKSMKKERRVYHIYNMLYKYNSNFTEQSFAVAAAESSEEAGNILEKILTEKRGSEYMKGKINLKTTDTGYTTSKKGLIFGFDKLSNSLLG